MPGILCRQISKAENGLGSSVSVEGKDPSSAVGIAVRTPYTTLQRDWLWYLLPIPTQMKFITRIFPSYEPLTSCPVYFDGNHQTMDEYYQPFNMYITIV